MAGLPGHSAADDYGGYVYNGDYDYDDAVSTQYPVPGTRFPSTQYAVTGTQYPSGDVTYRDWAHAMCVRGCCQRRGGEELRA